MAAQIPSNALAFYQGTRRHLLQQSTMQKPGANGGLVSIQLDRVGFLQGIWLDITAVIDGTITPAGVGLLGVGSIIRQVRVLPNAANDIYDVSGIGYFYLVNPFLGASFFPFASASQNQSATAFSADATVRLCMYIPVAMNRRDPIGLFNLQNPTTTVQLMIYFESDANLGTGFDVPVTCTVTPYLDILDLFDPRILPPQQYLHQIKEDSAAFTTGDATYQPQLGQKYLQVNHLLVDASSGLVADNVTRFRSLVNGSDVWFDETPTFQDFQYSANYGHDRPDGVLTDDFLASTELGTLSGLDRDVFDTSRTTDWRHIITLNANSQIISTRRQLIALSNQ